MCNGGCPAYDVVLYRTGAAEWLGGPYAPREGAMCGVVDRDEFRALARYARRCGFFSWNDAYTELVEGPPEFLIELVAEGVTKQVIQYGVVDPPGFGRLAARIDVVADSIRWAPSRTRIQPFLPPSWFNGYDMRIGDVGDDQMRPRRDTRLQ